MSYANIELTVHSDNVALLKLNRPERANCLSKEMRADLAAAFDELEANDNAKCLVLTGTDKVFCGGLDLKEVTSADNRTAPQFTSEIATLFEKAFFHSKPTIAAVSGGAFGGGFDIAALCDMRIASETAVFCQPELRLAVNPIIAPLWMNVGLGRAAELAFTAEPVNAAEAYRIGLVNHIYPVSDYLKKALELAAVIARHELSALKTTKSLFNQVTALAIGNALEMQFARIAEGFASEENSRAAAALLKKIMNK